MVPKRQYVEVLTVRFAFEIIFLRPFRRHHRQRRCYRSQSLLKDWFYWVKFHLQDVRKSQNYHDHLRSNPLARSNRILILHQYESPPLSVSQYLPILSSSADIHSTQEHLNQFPWALRTALKTLKRQGA
ncbi:hypothetical protein ONS95_004733 [Cadophora gregata]|uniref:uncharacterized protein n=1 Tax=Cadophora gregata TaxID=51156 RepID=UPI0026DC5346|nr:uncharacterized protein ONS95_004733 [Cadophora gregata]KAK0104444.1 hypothetical protein ONS95_004733 [Cadophora gregata]KAK0115463.1 hypothetical protein ONS96_013919 [Cadophora gregata f. sp. sojae]